MVEAGTCGFTDDGIPLTNAGFIKKAMEAAARVDMPISLHEEDPTLNEVNGVNKGVISDKMGIGGAPAISEDVMVARDVMLALETGAKVDIQHISSGRSVDLVRLAKKKGAKVYAEATPHHFTLTEEDVPNYGTMAKMNPPLRTEWDRTKIIEGLADGTIDMIATDHAPHAIEEKEREFTKAPSGIVGLETSLSLGITSLVKRGYLTMMQLLEKMTVNPARLYKFDCGTLEEGKAADIVIFAPDEVIRLFPRLEVKWEHKVHERPVCKLPKQKLSGILMHYTYDSWQQWLDKAGQYTSIWAEDNFSKGKRVGKSAAFTHGIYGFIRAYFLQLGFLDGWAGLYSSLQHFFYTLLKYWKLYELQQKNK